MKKKELKKAIEELTEAIRLTQEYVRLPALPGWSWFDVLMKYAPKKAERLRSMQQHPTVINYTSSSSSCNVSGCGCATISYTIPNYDTKDDGGEEASPVRN